MKPDEPPHRKVEIGSYEYEQMRLWFVEKGIKIPDNVAVTPSFKSTGSDIPILGDFSGEGDVNAIDLIRLWNHLYKYRNEKNTPYNIRVDINNDKKLTFYDLYLLGEYLYGDRDKVKRYGIGEMIKSLTPTLKSDLIPDPNNIIFEEDKEWKKFTLRVTTLSGRITTKSVKVIVNAMEDDDKVVDGSTYKSHHSCHSMKKETFSSKRNDSKIYLTGCSRGKTTIQIIEQGKDVILQTYKITVYKVAKSKVPDREEVFNIDISFTKGAFTDYQKSEINKAASKWSSIIVGDIPESPYFEWSGSIGEYPFLRETFKSSTPKSSGIVDDVRIHVGTFPSNYNHHYGGLGWILRKRNDSKIPYLGVVGIADSYVNSPDLYTIALHEIGHVLGFSESIFREKEFLDVFEGNFVFSGPVATKNWNYNGWRGFPMLSNIGRKSHWKDFFFQDGDYHWIIGEVMTPYIESGVGVGIFTASAMKDIGYEVNFSKIDKISRKKPVAVKSIKFECSVKDISHENRIK